jgi:hypothetical protein
MMKRTITGISGGSVAEDFSFAQVSFGTTLGIPITFQFSPRVLELVDATASAPVGGGKVVLAIRAESNILYHFALAPEAALRLLTELAEAEESARRQAAQTRQ